jgi:hypothetical protein
MDTEDKGDFRVFIDYRKIKSMFDPVLRAKQLYESLSERNKVSCENP